MTELEARISTLEQRVQALEDAPPKSSEDKIDQLMDAVIDDLYSGFAKQK